MKTLQNPFRGAEAAPLTHPALEDVPFPVASAERPSALLARCPDAAVTPLHEAPDLARACGVASVAIKDESGRMGLGSFKALGAAFVIARDAEEGTAAGRTYVTASAGNHGMSVAAGARVFGAKSRVYIAESVPEAFAKRLADQGADVRRAGEIYEEGMAAAMQAAEAEGLTLLSDSSWEGYIERPHVLMEGYTVLVAEAAAQLEHAPTHVFIQCGVGGIAAAVAAHARLAWGEEVVVVVVEPEAAPALIDSIRAGAPLTTQGPVSSMGRLDCKEPSLIALKGLARDADYFATISEEQAHAATAQLAAMGHPSTPSGTAGLAGLINAAGAFGLTPDSRVLTFLTEGAE